MVEIGGLLLGASLICHPPKGYKADNIEKKLKKPRIKELFCIGEQT